ncbi:MAG: TetR/AcrR family transcriptional regulator [bacterium]|nr:TetR/AcrR family transcriptional regulator [bacterium]
MARPADADPSQTRRRLLDVGAVEFAQHGYHATSTRTLAMLARVNISTLNHYYASKRGLYDACVDEVYLRLRARAVEVLAGSTFADIDVLFEKLYAIARAERDGVRLLVREVLDHGRLSAHTEGKHFLPEIENATRMTAELIGVDPARARTAAVTLGYLLSRFVIQDDRSLVAAFGVRSVKEAHARVVATLATTARALFGTPHLKMKD